MSRVRVCFCGTPDFAVTALKGLLADEHFEVVGVVTQPDRPAGRKMQMTPSPVKVLALEKGLRVLTPEKINQAEVLEEISKWSADVAVVVAFGQILSQKFLDMFSFGAVNLHGSLLPKWRGAAPIQRSIENGDAEAGVALQKIVKALDAGDVFGVRRCPITRETTSSSLYLKLADLGVELLHIELMDYIRGNLAPAPQDHSKVTVAKKIDKTEAEIKWTENAWTLDCRIRAFDAGPGTWTLWQGKKLKIHRARALMPESDFGYGSLVKSSVGKRPGTCVLASAEGLFVSCGQGVLQITELQPESRSRMAVADFLKGQNLAEGEVLGV